MMLEPLGLDECGALVANLLADDSVDDRVRVRIAEAAGGHPLYAEEMIGLLVDDGRLVLERGRWVAAADLSDMPTPPTISALLAARLDTLPRSERRVLDIASVMGQVFYPDAVHTLAANGADAIGAGIVALVRKQFVRPERSDLPAVDALAFRHLLIRDTAYQSIPKQRRADLHESFADWLERVAGDGVAGQEEIVGHHLEQAYRCRAELGPVGERMRTLARQAAERLAAAGRNAFARRDPLGSGEPPGASGRAAPSGRSAPARAPRGSGAGAFSSGPPARRRGARGGDRGGADPGRSPARGARGRAAVVRPASCVDPDAEQQAGLAEAERYAELFDGWSDDLGVSESLILVGTIRLLGRALRPGRAGCSSARPIMRAVPGADRRRPRSLGC